VASPLHMSKTLNMDYVLDTQEWTLDQVSLNFDSLDEMHRVSTSPSLSSLVTSDSYLDPSLHPDFLVNFCLEYYTTISDPILVSTPTTLPTPTTIPTPTPDRIPHSRGRRARRDESPKRKHRCSSPGCSDSFTRPEHLRRHQKAHNGEKPFCCQDCGSTFSRADNMTTHRRKTHDGV
jgi:uncharacterized Zn-finger protein